jgi:predicted nucleic acid-binding Zn ribbon protein
VSEVVDRILGRYRLQKQYSLFRVLASWEEIVGSRPAAHSRPLRLRGKVLEVRVDQAVWMQHLQLHKNKILAAVNRHLKENPVEDLFWRFGTLETEDEAPAEPSAAQPPHSVSVGELEKETEELLQSLSDPLLRETFRRLILDARERG